MGEQKINSIALDEIINIEKIVNHWIETSEEDFKTMNELFMAKIYHWSLFLGHISTEKLLKAGYVKMHQKHAPFTHNLTRLAELCELEYDETYFNWLDKITYFNQNTRYDDFKREFYKQCTKEFTEEWINNIKTLQTWIKNQH